MDLYHLLVKTNNRLQPNLNTLLDGPSPQTWVVKGVRAHVLTIQIRTTGIFQHQNSNIEFLSQLNLQAAH